MNPFTSRALSLAIALLAGCLGLAAPTFAQSQSTQPNIWIPPRLVIPVRTDLPVQMQSVRIRSEVSGRLAFTELELTFFNPNARVLEGELQFPLLDGQSVASFAMDLNGAMREAVPVDKARGQMVFEEVIRGRIDPALLEVTQGNSFKLRVYPIPASGTKRIVLRISETLTERKGRVVYRMPIEYAERVGTFALDLNVASVSVAPSVASQTLGPLPFNRNGNGFRAQFTAKDFVGRGVLDVEIGATRTPQVSTQLFEGKMYFHADVPLASMEAPRNIPNLVGLIWIARVAMLRAITVANSHCSMLTSRKWVAAKLPCPASGISPSRPKGLQSSTAIGAFTYVAKCADFFERTMGAQQYAAFR